MPHYYSPKGKSLRKLISSFPTTRSSPALHKRGNLFKRTPVCRIAKKKLRIRRLYSLYNIPFGRQKQFCSRETFSNVQTYRRRSRFPLLNTALCVHRAVGRNEYGFRSARATDRGFARKFIAFSLLGWRGAAADRCLTFVHRHGRDRICTIFSPPPKRDRRDQGGSYMQYTIAHTCSTADYPPGTMREIRFFDT